MYFINLRVHRGLHHITAPRRQDHTAKLPPRMALRFRHPATIIFHTGKSEIPPEHLMAKRKDSPMPDSITVAVGVLVERRDGRPFVLIARRPDKNVLGGFWELPGGKLEPNETLEACLAREFLEELGVTVAVGQPLPTVEYTYDHAHVHLHPFFCTQITGQPQNLQVTEHRWVPAEELTNYNFPPANAELIAEVVSLLAESVTE